MTVGDDGRFVWHVNPSTRPFAQKDRKFAGVAEVPAFEQDISSATPTPPGIDREIEFEVKPDAARQIQATISGAGPDYDIYLYFEKVADDNQVASSAGADANETISYGFPAPGKYILVINNYSAVSGYEGRIAVFGEQPGTEEIVPASKEAWTLTCESAGKVIGTRKVEVARGQRAELGSACVEAAGTGSALVLGASVKRASRLKLRTVARRGLSAKLSCSRQCTATASLQIDKRTAKRYGLPRTLARTKKAIKFSGKRGLGLRFGRKTKRGLLRAKTINARLVVVARDRIGNVRSRTVRVRMRR